MEERRRPAVALCDRGFLSDAKSAASSRGMPGLRSLGVVGSSPTDEQIRAEVSASIDNIVTALAYGLDSTEGLPQRTKAP